MVAEQVQPSRVIFFYFNQHIYSAPGGAQRALYILLQPPRRVKSLSVRLSPSASSRRIGNHEEAGTEARIVLRSEEPARRLRETRRASWAADYPATVGTSSVQLLAAVGPTCTR